MKTHFWLRLCSNFYMWGSVLFAFLKSCDQLWLQGFLLIALPFVISGVVSAIRYGLFFVGFCLIIATILMGANFRVNIFSLEMSGGKWLIIGFVLIIALEISKDIEDAKKWAKGEKTGI